MSETVVGLQQDTEPSPTSPDVVVIPDGYKERFVGYIEGCIDGGMADARNVVLCTLLACDPELETKMDQMRNAILGDIREQELRIVDDYGRYPHEVRQRGEKLARLSKEREVASGLLRGASSPVRQNLWTLVERKVVGENPSNVEGDRKHLRSLFAELDDPEKVKYWRNVVMLTAVDVFYTSAAANAIGWGTGIGVAYGKGGWDAALAYVFAEAGATLTPLPGLPNITRLLLYTLIGGFTSGVVRNRERNRTAPEGTKHPLSKDITRNSLIGLIAVVDGGYLLVPVLNLLRYSTDDMRVPASVLRLVATRGLKTARLIRKYGRGDLLREIDLDAKYTPTPCTPVPSP